MFVTVRNFFYRIASSPVASWDHHRHWSSVGTFYSRKSRAAGRAWPWPCTCRWPRGCPSLIPETKLSFICFISDTQYNTWCDTRCITRRDMLSDKRHDFRALHVVGYHLLVGGGYGLEILEAPMTLKVLTYCCYVTALQGFNCISREEYAFVKSRHS